MLELAILGLLKEQDLHGYELKKRLSETLGLASGVSFGSLYPALSRLEKAGAVKAVEAQDRALETIPLTGSLGGELAAYRARVVPRGSRGSRGKKVYGLTERGERLFEELLATESQSNDDDRLFNLRLAFARHLPPDARIGMLERRRVYLLDRLAALATRVRAGRERLDSYASSLIEHDREATAHDLSWVDRLIASERASAERASAQRASTQGTTTDVAPTDVAPTELATGLAGPDAGSPAALSYPRAPSPSLSGLGPAHPQEDITP